MLKKLKSLVTILAGLFASWHFMDLSNEETFRSRIAPVLFFIFLVCLLWWLVFNAGFGGRSSQSDGINLDISDIGDGNDGDSGSL